MIETKQASTEPRQPALAAEDRHPAAPVAPAMDEQSEATRDGHHQQRGRPRPLTHQERHQRHDLSGK
jgi:hypothetical protein